MKKYCGNGKPYIYGMFTASDREAALEVLETVCAAGFNVWHGEKGLSGAEKGRLSRAAAAMIFISPEAVEDSRFLEAVYAAARGDRPLITVFLKDAELDEGLSLLLGSTQGIMKHALPDGEFREKLLASPSLAKLAVTPAQKAAAKRGIAIAALGIVLTAAALVAALSGVGRGAEIDGDSLLGELGLYGNAANIKSVYLYGETLFDDYRLTTGVTRVTEETIYDEMVTDETTGEKVYGGADGRRIALAGTGEEFPWGELSDISDFSQLANLEELCLAGNDIADISPLKGLKKLRLLDITGSERVDITSLPEFPALETLNIAYCGFRDNPENEYDSNMGERTLNALLGCKTLRTVYVDCQMVQERYQEWDGADRTGALARALREGTLPFEVVVVDRSVSSWEELKAASLDESVFAIYIMDSIVIPEGETLTVRRGVSLTGAYCDVENHGTVELYGLWEMGLCDRKNYGTILVKSGGNYNGGMCSTENYGTFIIEEGGTAVLQRGHEYILSGGLWKVDGLFLIPPDGGALRYEGGDFVNNGRIALYKALWFQAPEMDFSALQGTGELEELETPGTSRTPQGTEPEQGGADAETAEKEPGCHCTACMCQDRSCGTPDCSCDCVSCTTGVGVCTCGQ